MSRYRIAMVPGDGIGPEIVPAAWQVLEAAAGKHEIHLEKDEFSFGAEHYRREGCFLPENGLETLSRYDAILFGAVGLPDVDDRLPFREFTNKIRCAFRQYVNYRPVRRYRGIEGPLRTEEPIDFVIIRENNEGEFVLSGSVHHADELEGVALQHSVFTRRGIARVARYAFELAARRRGKLTNVTKSNTLTSSLGYWDRVIAEVATDFADVEHEKMYVDNAAARFVLRPSHFDVVLSTNMMGDILSDLGGALMGSLGLGPSGNINPEKDYPSMFEPIHGSAPDIAGEGIANPIGAIESAALMLEHLGEVPAAERIRRACEAVLADGVHTPDLGGSATTADVAAAVTRCLETAN